MNFQLVIFSALIAVAISAEFPAYPRSAAYPVPADWYAKPSTDYVRHVALFRVLEI